MERARSKLPERCHVCSLMIYVILPPMPEKLPLVPVNAQKGGNVQLVKRASAGDDAGEKSEPHPDCWTEEIQIR